MIAQAIQIGASYSTFDEGELLSTLLPQYRIGKPSACHFWRRGVNDTYQVYCADAMYSLRIYRHGLRARSEIDFEMAALTYLNDQGGNVAYPIETKEGGYVTQIKAPEGLRYAVVTAYARGWVPKYKEADNARNYGASVAQLHNLSTGFVSAHERPRLDIDGLLDNSFAVVEPYLLKRTTDLEFLKDAVANIRSTIEAVPADQLDVGFCHGDCHGHNVHESDGVITHFDFDCCGVGFRAFDLATFNWSLRLHEQNMDRWTDFLEGYQSVREPHADHIALLDTFVVIRHIWLMALHMGNARDFGYELTSDGYIDHQLKFIRKVLGEE